MPNTPTITAFMAALGVLILCLSPFVLAAAGAVSIVQNHHAAERAACWMERGR